jgi:thiamine kinase-like enzyme
VRESRVSSLINQAGVPSPGVEEGLVRLDDGAAGILFERVPGRTLKELLREQRPGSRRFFELSRTIGHTHRRVHEHAAIDGLPSQRERLAEEIIDTGKLTLGTRKKLLRILQSQADCTDERVCHMDLHPSNILLEQGRATVIDWDSAVNGDPLCDVARTWTLLRYLYTRPRSRMRKLLKFSLNFWRISSVYLRAYAEGRQIDQLELRRWILLNSPKRLHDVASAAASKELIEKIERDVRKRA